MARIQALVPHDGRQKISGPWYWIQGSARECVCLYLEGEREPITKWEHGDAYLLAPWMVSEKWLFLGEGMCIIVIVRRAFGQTGKSKWVAWKEMLSREGRGGEEREGKRRDGMEEGR